MGVSEGVEAIKDAIDVGAREGLRPCLHLLIDDAVLAEELDVLVPFDADGSRAALRCEEQARDRVKVLIEEAPVLGFDPACLHRIERREISPGEGGR
ncbi:hypothetical protein WMF30_09480 [Sorangium sp. So ce134]